MALWRQLFFLFLTDLNDQHQEFRNNFSTMAENLLEQIAPIKAGAHNKITIVGVGQVGRSNKARLDAFLIACYMFKEWQLHTASYSRAQQVKFVLSMLSRINSKVC